MLMVTGEEVYLVLDVARRVVLRRGGEQSHVGAERRLVNRPVDQLVKRLPHRRIRIPEFVAFVDDDQTIVFVLKPLLEIAGVRAVVFPVLHEIPDTARGHEIDGAGWYVELL